jgi:hypothetical protein
LYSCGSEDRNVQENGPAPLANVAPPYGCDVKTAAAAVPGSAKMVPARRRARLIV